MQGHIKTRLTTEPVQDVVPARTVGREVSITVYGADPHEARLFRELAPCFGVLPRLAGSELSEDTVALAEGSRSISISHKARVSAPVVLTLARLGVRYISTRSIGCDHIDVDLAERFGIRVENVQYSPDSVADFTLMLMLMALRNAHTVVRRTAAHDFRLCEVRGRELRDLTVGVIGTGRIGAAVIERLRGFGSRILAYDKRPKMTAEYLPLQDLLEQSDIVTLHAPLTSETHHLLDDQRLGTIKRGAIVINTGRGALIDTWALIRSLGSGHLGGAALDVLEEEEGIFYNDRRNDEVPSQLLLNLEMLPNVIITPHTAFYTEHASRDMVENSILNCLNFERTLNEKPVP